MLSPKEIIGMIFWQGGLNQSNNLYAGIGKDSYGGMIKDSIGLSLYQVFLMTCCKKTKVSVLPPAVSGFSN